MCQILWCVKFYLLMCQILCCCSKYIFSCLFLLYMTWRDVNYIPVCGTVPFLSFFCSYFCMYLYLFFLFSNYSTHFKHFVALPPYTVPLGVCKVLLNQSINKYSENTAIMWSRLLWTWEASINVQHAAGHLQYHVRHSQQSLALSFAMPSPTTRHAGLTSNWFLQALHCRTISKAARHIVYVLRLPHAGTVHVWSISSIQQVQRKKRSKNAQGCDTLVMYPLSGTVPPCHSLSCVSVMCLWQRKERESAHLVCWFHLDQSAHKMFCSRRLGSNSKVILW